MKTTRRLLTMAAISCSLSNPIAGYADSLYQPAGANLVLGNVTHHKGILSGTSNPAGPAADATFPGAIKAGGLFTVGAGIEYGDIDDLFELYDEISQQLDDDNNDPGSGGGDDDTDYPVNLPTNPTFDDFLNANPQYQAWVDELVDQATFIAGGLALIAAEGYAKAYATGDLPFLISNDVLGGSITFSISAAATSKAIGIVDPFNFDKDQLLSQLDAVRNLAPDAGETEFQLSDGLSLVVNPSTNDVDAYYKNDSLLLAKAAKIYSVSVGYSREVAELQSGRLFVGVKPKLYRVGLTQLDTRIGDLDDTQGLFDDIRNGDYRYDDDISIDIGLLWLNEQFSLGLTVTDLFEPSFDFPALDFSRYESPAIINRLQRESRYDINRQFRFEGGWISPNRNWSVNLGIDSEAVKDPVGDSYQWASLSAGYQTSMWWLPDFRVGYRENLAGSELQYIGAGVTLFSFLNLDVATTLDSTTIEGNDLPRGLKLNLGFEVAF